MATTKDRTETVSRPAVNPTAARILDAAHDCLVNQGIAKSSIVDIAQAARYSRPIIYKHFANKEDIVDAVCINEMMAIQEKLDQQIPDNLPFSDRLTEVILQSVIHARDNAFICRFIEDGATWARSQSADGKVHQWVANRWHAFISRAQRTGLIADDLDVELAVTWIAMVQSLLLMRQDYANMDEAAMRKIIRRFLIEPMRP